MASRRLPFLLFTDAFAEWTRDAPLVFVDVGARGRLPWPWGEAGDRLRVIGFEADAEEAARLQASAPAGWRFEPKAAWSHDEGVTLHLAKAPAVSSVHPPNMELLKARYPSSIWAHRETARRVQVPSATLDQALSDVDDGAVFVKLDTQGSEQEILEGAERALVDKVYGVVAESWTVPLHKGQHLTGELMQFMAERGFALYDLAVGGACPPRLSRPEPQGKRQLVQLDLLFLRAGTEWVASARMVDVIKAVAIAELHGFVAEAMFLLEARTAAVPGDRAAVDEVFRALERNVRARRRLPRRVRLFVERLRNWGVTNEYAPLR